MKNNYNKTVEQLLKIEEELDLFNQKIDGVYFWERIRFGVLNEILMQSGLIGQAHTKIPPTFFNRLKNVFNAVKNVFIKNPFLAPRSDILFFGSPRRKLGEDNKWHDIYCDPIIENLSQSYTYIESTYLGKHLSPAATRNIRYYDLVLLLASLLRKVKITKNKFSKDDVVLITKVNDRIRQVFNVDVELFAKVSGSILSRKSQVPICRLLLKKINPKLVIIICSYGKENIIDAAKILNIPIVELQHGFISANHFGYSFPGPKRTKRSFPDYLLTFGDIWNSIAEFPITADKVISVGYPYLEKEIQEHNDVKKKDQIVFISQGTVGIELSKLAVDLSCKIDPSFKVIYKLHPGEYSRWRTEYSWLVNSNVMVVEDDSYPLYKIFAESKVQIGVSSTALFEGLAFELKTIIIPMSDGFQSMQFLFEDTNVIIADDIEKIIKETRNLGGFNKTDITKIFKLKAIDNMNYVLEQIVQGEKIRLPKTN